ncbi:MAG: hypothetical protein IJN87_10575 [Firmicutes bacterium]|nr:hypothetical protein [Bacillota bacterium]
MKKKNWFLLVSIAACMVIFLGYRAAGVIGNDTKAPDIDVNADILQVSVQDPREVLLQGVTATDNRDGDVTASLVVESVRLVDPNGTVSVGYAAFDSAGNVAKTTRRVQYIDYESPRFSLSGPMVFAEGSNFDVLSVISAQDMLDGEITHRIRATSLTEGSIAQPGTHNVEFRVTNSLGETVKLVIPVVVHAAGAYEANLTLTNYLVYVEAGSHFDAESYLDTFGRGTNKTYLKNGLPYNYSLYTEGEVDTNTPGVYSVDYSVTYTVPGMSGYDMGQSYTGYSKLIVVVEG